MEKNRKIQTKQFWQDMKNLRAILNQFQKIILKIALIKDEVNSNF